LQRDPAFYVERRQQPKYAKGALQSKYRLVGYCYRELL